MYCCIFCEFYSFPFRRFHCYLVVLFYLKNIFRILKIFLLCSSNRKYWKGISPIYWDWIGKCTYIDRLKAISGHWICMQQQKSHGRKMSDVGYAIQWCLLRSFIVFPYVTCLCAYMHRLSMDFEWWKCEGVPFTHKCNSLVNRKWEKQANACIYTNKFSKHQNKWLATNSRNAFQISWLFAFGFEHWTVRMFYKENTRHLHFQCAQLVNFECMDFDVSIFICIYTMCVCILMSFVCCEQFNWIGSGATPFDLFIYPPPSWSWSWQKAFCTAAKALC